MRHDKPLILLYVSKFREREREERAMESLPLHLCHVHKVYAIFNRSYVFVHSIALIALFYYRFSFLFHENKITKIPTIPWLLVFAAELTLSFIWLFNKAYRWRPVSRTAFPERLPEDKELPAIDVFVCTADPNREPTLEVMNTVISAMALDYPPEKLYVYVSDDGGSSVTLEAMREAWVFASLWLPFCRTFGIKTGSPEAYFSKIDDGDSFQRSELIEERQKIKEQYDEFKKRVMRIREKGQLGGTSIPVNRDHSPVVEVIMHDSPTVAVAAENREVPLLVYVSREKRPSHPHNFKAGALNVLLRVSGVISNSPYILSLDCDMYCNGNSSARQAMCFHLDPKISRSLAFVQFPQKFLNISNNDIYDSQWRFFSPSLQGMDGLEGPVLSGTGFYIKRKTFYGSFIQEDHIDLKQLEQVFGPSNEFIESLQPNHRSVITNGGESSRTLQLETEFLASCPYEKHTKWGEEVGFLYNCVVEDYLTSFTFHCKGWTSVYLIPQTPQFVGSATTSLDDVLVQNSRWCSGLVDAAFSKFCPIIYGPLRMSVLESMCYAFFAAFPFYCFPLCCLAVVPQICLLNGIPLYPEVSNSYFIVVAFIFISSHTKHLEEVFSTGGSILQWWNEERIWMIKSVTCYLYGTLDCLMKKMGMREANFIPTNKVADSEQVQLYQMGKFNFQTSNMFLVPLVTLVLLNIFSLVGGITRVIISRSLDKLFVQIFLSFYVVILSYPIIEGMIVRKDKGRIPSSATLLSAAVSVIFLAIFTTNWLDGCLATIS